MRGDAATALAAAPRVFEGVTEFGGQEHFYLETHASLAHLDSEGQYFVESSTQHPSETQEIVAHVMGIPSNRVTVQALRMGGAFGGKEMQPHGLAAIAALGAKLTGRPVRLRLNRTQDITMTGKRHPFHISWRAGFDRDGGILALEATLTADGGWCLDLSEPVLSRALCHFDNAYWIPHVNVLGRVAKTNKTSNTAFRGFGGPQGVFLIEDILGRVAPALGLDPIELRRRNFYQPGQTTPYGQPVKDAERMHAIWDQVRDEADVDARRAEADDLQRAARAPQARDRDDADQVRNLLQLHRLQPGRGARARLQGRVGAGQPRRHGDGSGSPHEDAPGGRHRPGSAAASGATGSDAHRQGAEHIGDRRIVGRRSQRRRGQERMPPDPRSDDAGRRSNARRRRRRRAILRRHGDGARRGSLSRRSPMSPRRRTSQRVQLFAAGYYRTEGLHWDAERMQGSPFKYFAYGAAATEVEVDGFTGEYRLRRVDIVHDVGDSLSPQIDLGQIEGGFVQGVGWLTLEELRWDTGDGPDRGRLLTQSASTYKLPSFSEMPEQFSVHFFANAREDGAVYGSKAVGEPPLMLAFSAREAIREAVGAFGPVGRTVVLGSPATPEAVFWAIQASRAAGEEESASHAVAELAELATVR